MLNGLNIVLFSVTAFVMEKLQKLALYLEQYGSTLLYYKCGLVIVFLSGLSAPVFAIIT